MTGSWVAMSHETLDFERCVMSFVFITQNENVWEN